LGNVEEIVVLKEGRIAEQGSFKDLKRRGGVFAALLEEQNRYNLEKAGEKSMILEKAAAQSMIRSAFAPLPGSYEQYQMQPTPNMPIGPVSPPPAVVQNWPGQPGVTPQPMQPAFTNRQQDGNGRQQPQPARNANVQPAAIPPVNARIVVELDGKIISDRPLTKPIMTVGRLSGNDVPVPSQRVSRLHAKIRWENGRWLIEDAESLNGLVYRGKRVDKLVLTNGDRIYVSPTAVLQYVTTP
jgi:FHA domain